MSSLRAPRKWQVILPIFLFIFLGCISAFSQVINGTISGDVKDATGAYIPKATVTAKAPAIGVNRTTTTNGDGVFVMPNLPPGEYTISVSAPGFTQLDKKGIYLSTGDRLNAGVFVLQVGAAGTTVTVEAEAGQLQVQADSGERSSLVSGKQINDLGMNGRMIFDYLKVIPGITSTFNGEQSNKGGIGSFSINGTRAGQVQYTIDGATNIDNGCNCATAVTINPDAIAEVKVLTSSFQAEYGKAAGGQIAVTTKSGTNAFHGGASWDHRHEQFNAMPWFQKQTNFIEKQQNLPTQDKQPLRYNYFNYQLGGPVLIPGTDFNKNRDKVYFYFNQQFYRQLLPGGFDRVYMPTLDEINGDFSKSKDGHGNPITIIDPLTGNPFPGNVIPSNRINPAMQAALLKVYPRPNASDEVAGYNRYNYVTSKTTTFPRREDIGRLDYQINSSNRMFFRVVNNEGSQTLPEGLSPQGISNFQFPGGMFLNEPGYTATTNLTSNINNTTVNELSFGWTVNHQHIYSVNNNVARSKYNIDLPLYYKVTGETPIPDFSFGGRQDTWGTWSYLGSIPWNNAQTIINITDNLTKVMGKHTFKAGIFFERTRKDQDAWGNYNAQFNFDGKKNPSEQPLQTGDPYANALLGYYSSFNQSSIRPRGYFRYTNLEWYVQDNFKVTHRLTLDYGMRFAWVQPQYDKLYRAAFFDPTQFDFNKAVRLYAHYPDKSGRAWDPQTGQIVNGSLYGTIVPGSGDPLNGVVTAGDGYPGGGFEDRGIMLQPRFGFAFDVFGNGKTVIRGGAGMSHDRFQGNPIYSQVTDNPLTMSNVNFGPGQISSIPTLQASSAKSPVGVVAWQKDGQVPTVYSFNLGIQHDLGWGTTVDVAYVGSQSRHLSQKYNLNSVAYGAVFQASAQDASKYCNEWYNSNASICEIRVEDWIPSQYKAAGYQFMGDKAYDANFLRKYQGYGDVAYWNWDGTANYNSLQVAVNKRFSDRLTFGVAYTFSKTMTTSNSDGEWTSIINPKVYNYKLASFDRPHNLVFNYAYDLPKFSKFLGGSKALGYITDGFTWSGVTQFMSGAPQTLGGNTLWWANEFFSGSYNEWWNVQLKGDPTKKTSNPYGLLDPSAFAFPDPGNPTTNWPKQYFRTGGTNRWDMTLAKNIPLGNEKRSLQLRVDAFNVFNHPQFWGINTDTGGGNPWDAAFNIGTYGIVRSDKIRPEGKLGNMGQYFGEYNNGGDERRLQFGVRLYF